MKIKQTPSKLCSIAPTLERCRKLKENDKLGVEYNIISIIVYNK